MWQWLCVLWWKKKEKMSLQKAAVGVHLKVILFLLPTPSPFLTTAMGPNSANPNSPSTSCTPSTPTISWETTYVTKTVHFSQVSVSACILWGWINCISPTPVSFLANHIWESASNAASFETNLSSKQMLGKIFLKDLSQMRWQPIWSLECKSSWSFLNLIGSVHQGHHQVQIILNGPLHFQHHSTL